jgi:hypothetical protein
MKIAHIETLISKGSFSQSAEWTSLRNTVHEAVKNVEWPVGTGKFTIYPESGKKRGEGNGVKPIKNGFIAELKAQGWEDEEDALPIAVDRGPGGIDIVHKISSGSSVAVEWETGNVSSSHRALNKMALGLMKGYLAAAMLIVPTRKLAQYLTDRIGNYPELEPYFDLWRSVPCESGVFEIIVIEHDETSKEVPKIPALLLPEWVISA